MRRVEGASSLATINPTVRTARDSAGKEGDVSEMFAETISIPACVVPAAAEPQPLPAAIPPAAAEPQPLPAAVEPAPQSEAQPQRLAWHERMTRAIASRFRRPPREEEPETASERLERFHMRRSGPGPNS